MSEFMIHILVSLDETREGDMMRGYDASGYTYVYIEVYTDASKQRQNRRFTMEQDFRRAFDLRLLAA